MALGDSTVSVSIQQPATCMSLCNLSRPAGPPSPTPLCTMLTLCSLCCRTIRPNSAVRSIYKASGCSDNPNHHVNYLEHVVVRITITHPRRGDLAIYLTSPSGTRSQLLANRYCDGLWPPVYRGDTNTQLLWKVESQLLLMC